MLTRKRAVVARGPAVHALRESQLPANRRFLEEPDRGGGKVDGLRGPFSLTYIHNGELLLDYCTSVKRLCSLPHSVNLPLALSG